MQRGILSLFFALSLLSLKAQFSVTTVPPLNGGNGSQGISFNIKAKQADIIIDSFYCRFGTTASQTVDVWYSPVAINGSPNISTSNGWVLIGSVPVSASSTGVPFPIGLDLKVAIPAGQKYGFFIESSSVTYSNTAVGVPDTFFDNNITIYTGTNVGYGGPAPNPLNHPRQFNGTVFYSLDIKAANDAGVASIDSPAAFCPGVHTIKARIKNYGINTISGVAVNWTLNGLTMPSVNYNGTLDTINGVGNNTALVTLGQQNFVSGQTYTVKAWTSNPNGVADTNNNNDTASAQKIPALSGTFTIGGASPDFATIGDAVQALNASGVCGPTELLIRPGTYNEQIVLSEIKGVSPINTITFKSTTGDSSDVIVTTIGTSTDNYVLLIDGADYTSFERMTFRNTGTSYGTPIRFGPNGTSIGNVLYRCDIEGGNGQTTSSLHAGITSDNGIHKHNTIRECYIHNCSYGVYWPASSADSNHIEGNIVHPYYMGVSINGQHSPFIQGNHIRSNTILAITSFYGLYLTGLSGTPIIEGNDINIATGAYGIYLTGSIADPQAPGLVANNMIHIGGIGTAYGIYTTGSTSNFGLYFNTVNVTSINTGSTIAWINASSGSGLKVMNNIFSNQGGGNVVSINAIYVPSIDTADHNCYYTTGGTLGLWGTSATDLTALQAASGMDANSLEEDPLFFDPMEDLHVTSGFLNGQGTPIARVPLDIDGDSRSQTTPDLGADEFTPFLDDAGVASVDSPSAFCPGVHTIRVTIQNFGNNLIHSVTVNWTLNGVPMFPFTYNGTLDSITGTGSSSVQVDLGLQNFVAGQTYTVRAWTTNPNGMPDPNSANDTITAVLAPAISGTFTIGGTTPDYATLSDAAQILNLAGVCGPTEFLIRPGTYNERVELDEIAGASSVNTITFKSTTTDSTDVVVTAAAASSTENYVLQLNGADYVSFEYISFQSVGTTWGQVILLGNTGVTEHNTFLRCDIQAGSGITTSSNQAAIFGNTGTHNSNKFMECYIHNCSYGFYWITSGGNGNVVEDNVIHSYYMGVRMDDQVSPQVLGNEILSNTQGVYNFYYGVYMNTISGTPLLIGNRVNAETGAYGLYLGGLNAAAQSPGLVANNMIHVGGAGTAYGIYTAGVTSNIRLYNNTVSITSPNTTSGRCWINASSGTGIQSLNNIFSNHGGGVTVYISSTNVSSVDTSNYNCYYTTGSNLGLWGNAVFDLASLQAQNGMDANSVFIDPGFFNNSQNLHATSGILDNKGTHIAAVPDDIDGEVRSLTTPDIGADEFDPLQNDVGVLFFENPTRFGCNISDSTVVTVAIANYGAVPQSNFDVTLQIFSIIVTTETVPGTVLPGDTLYYSFNTRVDLSVPAIYPLKAWTTQSGDQNSFNDSILFHPIFSEKYVRNFPYVMDFETSMTGLPLSWINDPFEGQEDWLFDKANSTNSPAPLGMPGDHTTGTGYFAWVDNSSPSEPVTNLYSPCLDFTNLSNPFLEFYLWNSDINNSIMLHVDIWSNGKWNLDIVPPLAYQSSTEWAYHLISLQQFAGMDAKVRFRAEETGLSSNFDLGLDDIKIFNLGPINTSVIDELQPTSGCGLSDIEEVEVWIVQFGYDTLQAGETIPVGFTVDGGPALTETVTLTAPLAQFDSVKYKFNNIADLSQTGDHVLKIWTRHPQDDDFTNDTLTIIISNVLITNFTYVEDFESFQPAQDASGYDDYWYTDPENTTLDYRWNVNQGVTPTATTGPPGDFDQSGDGIYLYTEASNGNQGNEASVYTPCIDLSSLNSPGFNIAYHMYGSGIGSLHFDVQVNGNWINDIRPPYVGDLGNVWHETAVKLQAFAGQTVVLRFRAIHGANLYGDMAIDGFKLGELPNVAFPDTIRSCGSVKLDAGPDGVSYLWSTGQGGRTITVLGDPVNPVTQPIEVRVTNAEGLKNWASTVVILDPGPVLDLGTDTLVCGLDTLTLNAGNPGMTHLWDNSTTQQTRAVTTDGTYSVTVDNGQGCVKEDTIEVAFGENPVADFNSQRPGSQFDVEFYNSSSHGVSYLWDFGDGVFSTSATPIHHYQSVGVFSVKLIVYNECGADSIIQSISTFPIGIETHNKGINLQLAPNPTNGIFVVKATVEQTFKGGISLYDVKGQEIHQKKINWHPGEHTMSFDLTTLPNGVYWLILQDGTNRLARPIVKQ